MKFPAVPQELSLTGAREGTLCTLESLGVVLPDMSLQIVPRVGFIFAFSALETIPARRRVNVYKLSSLCRTWILPDLFILFLDNLLSRLNPG